MPRIFLKMVQKLVQFSSYICLVVIKKKKKEIGEIKTNPTSCR